MNPKTLCDQNTPWQLAEMVIELKTEMAGIELMDAEGTSFAETIVRDNATLKSENEKQAKELSNCRYSMMMRRGISDIYLDKVDRLKAERDALRTALGCEKEDLFNAVFDLETELTVLRETAAELLEVAYHRGDNILPHPEDDPRMWTARMQTAWDELEEVINPKEAPNENPQT